MKKTLIIIILISSFMLGSDGVSDSDIKAADCVILKDENSIICKYTFKRAMEDKMIVFEWINPDGEMMRNRTNIAPAGHGSIYDFRYISGRLKGIWTFRVLDGEDTIETTFELN